MSPSQASLIAPDVEARVLSVLLTAETVREAATDLLRELSSLLDDGPAAIAMRDRDGVALHVIAEAGTPAAWPKYLAPQFAVSAQPGVDPQTHVLVVPLRARGAVVGALLLGEGHNPAPWRDEQLQPTVSATAEVLASVAAQAEAEIDRRAIAMRSVESVVQGMAHQMANPLTGASAIAQLLIEELTDEGQRAAVRQMHQEMKRVFAVLNDLLELQRDTMAQDGVIDLSTFVERLLRFRAYAIREHGITVEFQPSSDYVPVKVPSRMLEHALLLALQCAEQRSQASVNRRIAIDVTEAGAEARVTITDSSAGELPELQPAYFDLPLHADPARARHDGTPDLGLLDSLLRARGGRLEMHGSKTDGMTLSLLLPRAQSTQTG